MGGGVIRDDMRGMGSSDRGVSDVSVEARVLDPEGVAGERGPAVGGAWFAARRPGRVLRVHHIALTGLGLGVAGARGSILLRRAQHAHDVFVSHGVGDVAVGAGVRGRVTLDDIGDGGAAAAGTN